MQEIVFQVVEISIHALRAEGDGCEKWEQKERKISIHALRAEGDAIFCPRRQSFVVFLSTPSVRRATLVVYANFVIADDFYPRPPCGGRRG